MRKYGKGLMAMESVEETVTGDSLEVAQTAAEVVEGTVEITEDSDVIEDLTGDVEDAIKADEELTEVKDVVEDAVESGEGLSEEAAEMASIAIESIRNRIGYTGSVRLVPATESFGNTNTRMASSKIVVEKLSETLARVWAQIKAAAARVKEFIIELIGKIVGGAAALKRHIKGMEEALKTTGDELEKPELENKRLAASLSYKGKADFDAANSIGVNVGSLLTAVPEMSKTAGLMAAEAIKLTAANEMTFDSLDAYLKSGETLVKKGMDQVEAIFKAEGKVFSAKDVADKAKAGETEVFGPFANNQCLVVTKTKFKVKDAEHELLKAEFAYPEAKPAEKIAALNKKQIEAVLTNASYLTDEFAKLKKSQSNYEQISNSLQKVSDTLIKQAEKIAAGKSGGSDDEKKAGEAVRQSMEVLRKQASGLIAMSNTFGNVAPTVAYKTAKALADYASASIKNLKKAA